MKKIVVSVISTDQVPELGDELREKCDESLAEFNVDIYLVIKIIIRLEDWKNYIITSPY